MRSSERVSKREREQKKERRSQEAATEKLFMAYGSRKNCTQKSAKIKSCTFQFSLIPISRIDLSLQHCAKCVHINSSSLSHSLHSLVRRLWCVCRWKKYSRKLLYLYFLHLIKLHSCSNNTHNIHWQVISS